MEFHDTGGSRNGTFAQAENSPFMKSMQVLPGKLERIVVAISIAVFTMALALFGYIGSYTRFWADDYCYSAFITAYGWWMGIINWYLTSGNRFSTVATVGVFDLFGPSVVPLLPAMLLIFWVAAWYFLLSEVSQAAGWKIGKLWLLGFALAQVYFVSLLSPDRMQVIYWRMGKLHYAFPLPWLMFHLALIIKYLRAQPRFSVWPLLLAGISAFYMAGHSETTTFLQLSVFGVGLLASLVFLKGFVRSRAAWLMAVSVVGTLAALVILFLSPQNASRLENMPPPGNLWLIIPFAFRYVFDFVFYSMRGQIIPYAAFICFCLAASILILAKTKTSFTHRNWLTGVGVTVILSVIFIFSSFLPSAYANLQYPGGRALMPACFILLAGLGMAAFFGAGAIRSMFAQNLLKWVELSALVLCLGCVLYPVRPVAALLRERDTMAVWAARWDARDQEIRDAVSGGVFDVRVRQYEVITNLEDLGPEPGFWINACAATYYGASSITASP